MTKSEYRQAYRNFEREMGWRFLLLLIPWLVITLGIAIHFRHWFGRHDMVSLLFIAVMSAILIAPLLSMCWRLRERHDLVCHRCGNKRYLLWTGQCLRCKSMVYDDDPRTG
jgi:hypothetical protein